MCTGASGCIAEALVVVIAVRSEIISESLAVAEGVNRTLLPNFRLLVSLGNLVSTRIPLEAEADIGSDDGIWTTLAMGAVAKGCRSIGPYTLRGGRNRGAIRLGSGADTLLVGIRDREVLPEAARLRNL
jgi:hypothetical protein